MLLWAGRASVYIILKVTRTLIMFNINNLRDLLRGSCDIYISTLNTEAVHYNSMLFILEEKLRTL